MIVLLIDGLNLIRRVYAAVPGEEGTAAHHDGVLQSMGRSVTRAITDTQATHALCAMDAPGPGWRHNLHPSYKLSRPPMPAALRQMLPDIAQTLSAMRVPSVQVPRAEADDLLTSIALKVVGHGGATAVILSTDKSMLSLLRPGIKVRNHFERRDLDASYVLEKFGITPEQLPDWLALVGDAAQGIPGVKGVGPKTASALLRTYTGLEAILRADTVEGVGASQQRGLINGADRARLSRSLVTLRTPTSRPA